MKKLLLLIFFTFPFAIKAQYAGQVAQGFGASVGFNLAFDRVKVIALQSDGKILLGGTFTSFHGSSTSYNIIRLNTDGSKDNSFNIGLGFNDTTNSIVVQNDGKILIGGKFTSFNGITENGIIRLNTDGTKDTSFITGTGFNDNVSAIAVQNDGKIIVGGSFNSFNGATENNIIRLNTNGTKDLAFDAGTGFDYIISTSVSTISSIVVQNDGKILLGGDYDTYNGLTEKNIIRLHADGTKDNSFNSGTGFFGPILSMALQSDGKIIIGGVFTLYNGVTENRIIRLNTDGTKDISFNTGTGFNGYVNTITVESDGKILAGGMFTSYNGTTQNRIIRLNTDGAKDTSFYNGTGISYEVEEIVVQNDGKILLGGAFSGKIGRINADGTVDPNFNYGSGFNFAVNTFAEQSDGKILVGGSFTAYNGITENRIIRLNSDGTKDTSFTIGTGFNNNIGASFNKSVNIIAVQSDGKILVGGGFITYNGMAAKGIIRLNTDGTKDTSFNAEVSSINYSINSHSVLDIAIQNDGKIILVGQFTSFNGTTENSIIRLNADGTKDASFITGTGFPIVWNSSVNTVAVQSDGKILVGGSFHSFNGVTEKGIIRLNTNGTKDTSFNIGGTGFVQEGGEVNEIVLQNDGKIILGGGFLIYNGQIAKKIIRLNTDGTNDTSFFTGTGFNMSVEAIEVQNDGKIIVGGSVGLYFNGEATNGIIRLHSNGTKDTSFIPVYGFTGGAGQVFEIKLLSNDKILVGGNFPYYNYYPSPHLISLHTQAGLDNENFTYSDAVSIWPNPTSEILNISSIDNTLIYTIKIYDLFGKLLYTTTSNTVDVSEFPTGLYIVKIKTEEGELTKKFIKR